MFVNIYVEVVIIMIYNNQIFQIKTQIMFKTLIRQARTCVIRVTCNNAIHTIQYKYLKIFYRRDELRE
jgi:hypothetical protein